MNESLEDTTVNLAMTGELKMRLISTNFSIARVNTPLEHLINHTSNLISISTSLSSINMDQFANIASQFQSSGPANWPSIVFKNTDISARTQSHLSRVYQTLILTLLAACFGVVTDIRFSIGGLMTTLASVVMLFVIHGSRTAPNSTRLAYLSAFGFLTGLGIGPLINMALHIDSSLILLAFLSTTAIFAAFSLSAIMSERRSYFFLGGIISSVLSMMMITSLLSLFVRLHWVSVFQLYGGLAVFCAYILFDTQMIIEKAENGSDDYISHALELFQDFVAVFVRILIILMKNSQQKQQAREKKSVRR